MKRVLVVDDEESVHRSISLILQLIDGVTVEGAINGQEALDKAEAHPPDLIVSDVVMPEMDGWTLTSRLRGNPALAHVPILLLTARTEDQDKYKSFVEGADDYLAKPFDPIELQLRVKALLRRSAAGSTRPAAARVKAGALTLLPQRYVAVVNDQEVKLTASELSILRHLALHPEAVVSVEELLTQALDYPPTLGNPQVVHTHMKNIRRKFREAGVDFSFLTSSRRGYMLVETA